MPHMWAMRWSSLEPKAELCAELLGEEEDGKLVQRGPCRMISFLDRRERNDRSTFAIASLACPEIGCPFWVSVATGQQSFNTSMVLARAEGAREKERASHRPFMMC